MSANRRQPKITESCTIKENIGRLIARCRKERNVGKFYSKISSTILRNWEIRGNYNPGVASRRFSLSFYRETSFDVSTRKGTKRKHWTELVTAQGKGKGTFVNFVRTSRRELFLEIGKYEDKLFDELLNEHRRSLLLVLRAYLQTAEHGYAQLASRKSSVARRKRARFDALVRRPIESLALYVARVFTVVGD